ncbi:retinol dehydrogenase 11-like [Coccinella septempunctata]|uniref:retinol dehydrogenase 11-like n=1 Tax=Coccinella septempunctata TaxID=41139 RepID=UPI001D099583|nr:retinol dehydrogenase 11-like [Coccinella septempunctata]
MLRSSLYALPFLILYGLRKYVESKWGKCKNKIKLDGKVVIITGANSGIGLAVAEELAARNATVIFACRDLRSAELAIERIRKIKSSANLIPMELDLASLKSIDNFVIKFKRQFDSLDILINNAGVSQQTKRELTKDNLEIHFGVNYLGHFYLTNSLLDILEKSRPSKVIIVSSKLHEKGHIHLDDLNSVTQSSKSLYSNSKLANVFFCQELARRTLNKGIDIFAVCPGWVYTNLFRHYIKWYHYVLLSPIAFFFMRSAKQGAQTIVYCATEPGLQTGIIYRDCRMYESKYEFDPVVSTQLWTKSEEIIEKIKEQPH